MSATTDTAKDLVAFLAGPPAAGTAILFGYVSKVMTSRKRSKRKGWTVVGAGLLLATWFVLFLIMAFPPMVGSWTSDGDLEPLLVLLSGAGAVAVGGLILLFTQVGRVARYLSGAYHRDDAPWHVRFLRKVFRISA